MRIHVALGMLLVVAAGPAAAQHGRHAVEIPLRVHGGALVVPVDAPDGTQLEFLVGMGSLVTVLSETGAKQIGEQTGLTLGGVPFDTDSVPTGSDADFTIEGTVFAGLVASNTLNQFDVLFDVPGGRLVLQAPGRSVSWAGMSLSEPVRLRLYHGAIISFDLKLNGEAYPAMLDLGLRSLIANEEAGAEAAVQGDRVETLTIGGTTYTDLPVRVEDTPITQRFTRTGGGFVLVGAPIAWDCALSVSYVHQELRTCVR